MIRGLRLRFNHAGWLGRLPEVYRREPTDAPAARVLAARNDAPPARPVEFLDGILGLLEAAVAPYHEAIDALPALFDPAVAARQRVRPEPLRWLADLLALDLPSSPDAVPAEALATAFADARRRGTADGLRAQLRHHTGVEAVIEEPHRTSRLWRLGSSHLGDDTALRLRTRTARCSTARPRSTGAT